MSARQYNDGDPIPSRKALAQIARGRAVLTPTLVPDGLDPMWVRTTQKSALEMFDWARANGFELVAHEADGGIAVVFEFAAKY